jgi:hypothetical protein
LRNSREASNQAIATLLTSGATSRVSQRPVTSLALSCKTPLASTPMVTGRMRRMQKSPLIKNHSAGSFCLVWRSDKAIAILFGCCRSYCAVVMISTRSNCSTFVAGVNTRSLLAAIPSASLGIPTTSVVADLRSRMAASLQ